MDYFHIIEDKQDLLKADEVRICVETGAVLIYIGRFQSAAAVVKTDRTDTYIGKLRKLACRIITGKIHNRAPHL